MILSVSRRTDIPAFYSTWFMNRIKSGFVMVRNPFNHKQISKISLNPEYIDCIVFWTKNAQPIMKYLDEISNNYLFYFQYTLNAYDRDIEPSADSLENRLEIIKQLSSKIGKEKVIWRYDPILISDKYTVNWHISQFEKISNELSNYVETCVFSFLDIYDKIIKNIYSINGKAPSYEEKMYISKKFSQIAEANNIKLKTCSEDIELSKYNIRPSCCIDPILIGKLLNCEIKTKKDSNQRQTCGCVESIDIGEYNTCLNGCLYCYANYSYNSVIQNCKKHDVNSPLLIGDITSDDKVTERKISSSKDIQLKLF